LWPFLAVLLQCFVRVVAVLQIHSTLAKSVDEQLGKSDVVAVSWGSRSCLVALSWLRCGGVVVVSQRFLVVVVSL
jgi:hypothetical protein